VKWLALLAGAAVLAFALFLLPRRAEAPRVAVDPGSVPAPSPPAAEPALRPAPTAAPTPERPQNLALHGVLYRGPASDQSQALLSVAGAPAAPYARGQPVADGWSLQAIEQNHVVLAKGAAVARLDIVETARPAAPANASAAAAAAAQERLPGFVAGAPPAGATVDAAQASERNRAFLQARQQRLAASAARR